MSSSLGNSVSRLQEQANFLLVAGIAHAANFQALTVPELKLAPVPTHGGAGAAVFVQQLRDFRSVLAHVAAADQAGQHRNITSDFFKNHAADLPASAVVRGRFGVPGRKRSRYGWR